MEGKGQPVQAMALKNRKQSTISTKAAAAEVKKLERFRRTTSLDLCIYVSFLKQQTVGTSRSYTKHSLYSLDNNLTLGHVILKE